MSTTQGKPGFTSRTNMPAFGAFGTQQPASLLFEKSNPGLRRSTPDSEALASSDDEVEQSRSASQKLPKPTRRTSWLNDVSAANAAGLNRKPSITAQYSPSTSNPGTPGTGTDQLNWSSLGGQASWNTAPTSSPWGSIWSQDNRGGPPSRLTEVMAHPETGIPFSIPLQPTPKAYRSQSYSVGQLDNGPVIPPSGQSATASEAPRTRMGAPNPSLQRRTSRPSGLGLDSGGLGRVREVEGDEEEVGRQNSTDFYTSQARQMERLQHENAQLRQSNQLRDRTVSAGSATTIPTTSAFRGSRLQATVPEEFDSAVDDHDSLSGSGLLPHRENGMRRLSEQGGVPFDRQNLNSQDARAHENNRKAQWSTSLGFGGIPEGPQSRRHSLADVPTRQGSFSSHGIAPARPRLASLGTDIAVEEDHAPAYDSLSQEAGSQGDDREFVLSMLYPTQAKLDNEYLRVRHNAAAYFATTDLTRRAAEAHVHSAFMGHPFNPHSHLGTYMGPASQPLHIVNFKCCRSDVFYVQDGTGLQVNVGDLVIVEADRGTDLGTVQHVSITWDEARRFKEHYAEEHYKWLMMFSQQSRNGGPNVLNPNGLPGPRPGSAVGGMGPPGHHGSHDSGHAGELKPKMIKRLAQNHEIQTLKDKEGNEAKAKRSCQQKVVEHRLNMEILDAEFQMDGKKLTFYYFADTYINFNSLVTDLFKVYKTRIWMSAINPASFQTPTSSLGLQPAFGGHAPSPGMGGHGRDSPSGGGRRRQNNQSYTQQQTGPGPMGFQELFDNDRFADQGNMGMRNTFMNQYTPFPGGPGMPSASPGIGSFAGQGQDPMDPYGQFNMYGSPYGILNPAAPTFNAGARGNMGSRGQGGRQGASPADEWTSRFQGLSLGSQ